MRLWEVLARRLFAPVFRRAAGSRGWPGLLAVAAAVGALAGLLLGYLSLLQLIGLEDGTARTLVRLDTHRFALGSALEGWGFLAPPCIAIALAWALIYGVGIGALRRAEVT